MTPSDDLPESQASGRSAATMQFVLIIHEVECYPAWKAVFDDAAAIRTVAGEISYQLLRDAADQNRVVHLSA